VVVYTEYAANSTVHTLMEEYNEQNVFQQCHHPLGNTLMYIWFIVIEQNPNIISE